MIKINRQEADRIRKELPHVQITTVNRTKKYKKYWCEEDRAAVRLVQEMRGIRPRRSADQRQQRQQRDRRDYQNQSRGKQPWR